MTGKASDDEAPDNMTPADVRDGSDGEDLRTSDAAATSDSVLPRGKTHCPQCWNPMWKDAKFCTTCSSYRGLRGWLNLVNTFILGLLATFFGVLASVTPYVKKVIDRHSETSFAVGAADEDVIYLYVMNDGLKAARLRGYQLHFGDLPIESTRLVLSDDDKREGKNYMQSGGTKLGLLVTGLRPRVRKPGRPERFTKREIDSMISGHDVTLEMEIQESDDPKEGPWSTQSETFPAEVIRDLILKKIPDSLPRRQ